MIIIFSGLICSAQAGDGERKIHVLIVDGFSNHDWRQTTSLLRGILDRTGLFEIAVSTAPETAGDPAWVKHCDQNFLGPWDVHGFSPSCQLLIWRAS
jgi:hypothetical protein